MSDAVSDLERLIQDMLYNEPKAYLSPKAYEAWLKELEEYRASFKMRDGK